MAAGEDGENGGEAASKKGHIGQEKQKQRIGADMQKKKTGPVRGAAGAVVAAVMTTVSKDGNEADNVEDYLPKWKDNTP